jgi:hypothetical protein
MKSFYETHPYYFNPECNCVLCDCFRLLIANPTHVDPSIRDQSGDIQWLRETVVELKTAPSKDYIIKFPYTFGAHLENIADRLEQYDAISRSQADS